MKKTPNYSKDKKTKHTYLSLSYIVNKILIHYFFFQRVQNNWSSKVAFSHCK